MRANASPSPQERDRPSSPGSQDGAAAPRDRDSYDPRISRPRRHQHDFRGDPRLNKTPDRGSYSSLPDSGISDQDLPRERRGPPDDALAHLPGPGKLKQLTHQRGDNDLDSGFMGSVVSVDGAHSPARHRLPETPLRLRDRNENRPRVNSADSTSTAGGQRPGGARNGASRRSQPAPPPPVPALVGINRSTDRSYDGELDESTLSDTQASGQRGSGRRGLSSRDASGNKTAAPRGRKKGEEASVQSLSLRSQSLRSQSQTRATHGDETLEDVSDGEMSDTATSQRPRSSQHSHTPTRAPFRPPTPHQPSTPQRPPTPYRPEPEEEEEEVEVVEEGRGGRQGGRMRGGPGGDQVLLNRSQQRRSRSPPARAPTDLYAQRPQSRGEPTTDLYHTRPLKERSRDRSREGERAMTVQSARAPSRQGGRGSVVPQPTRGEERGAGSDVEIASEATRGSSINSARLRALQDEIEKLKEGVKQAHEVAAQRTAPPPPGPPAPQQGEPQYFDPFDDPYGFMRFPLRRANSFSGGRVRDFDDWCLNQPGDRKGDDGDIPLGYAAADAYNRHHRQRASQSPQRSHHRGNRPGGEETLPKTVDGDGATGARTLNAAASVPSTRRSLQIHRPPTSDPQALYSYYVPSRHGGQPGLPAPAPASNPYRQHTTPLSASQPNLAGTLAGAEPVGFSQQSKRPWYTIRRAQWPAASGSGAYYPTLGYQGRRAGHQMGVAQAPPQQPIAVQPAAQEAAGYRMEVCPLCGGAGAHIHEDDVEPVQGYVAQDFATHPEVYSYPEYRRHERKGRSRQRSRSASRSRHYTPERSSSHSRYLVREYGDSISDDSDLEPGRGRRRSRSLSRTRAHSETRSSSGRSSSRRRGRHYRRNTEVYDSDEDVDLNESLVLSGDINRLTRRMLGTVEGELRRHRNRKEFGSSHW